MFARIGLFLMLASLPGLAGTDSSWTNGLAVAPTPSAQQNPEAVQVFQRTEQTRSRCIEGRRYIAGRVLRVLPEGLVVDSGYSKLLWPPLNRSWVLSGTASVSRDTNAVEENKPDAVCIGLVLLSNIPKRPLVKAYDYVVIHAYPAGDYVYSPVAGVQQTVRRFSASLDRAVQATLARESK
jgi:hypothetical protein